MKLEKPFFFSTALFGSFSSEYLLGLTIWFSAIRAVFSFSAEKLADWRSLGLILREFDELVFVCDKGGGGGLRGELE